MHASVYDAWRPFNQPLEGLTAWMYLDIKGLVTTGMGNLIDPVEAALALPWQRPDGRAASVPEIRDEWQRIKDDTALAHQGAEAARRVATLRLPGTAVDRLIRDALDRAQAILKSYPSFAELDDWPADAQLGLLSMAWAMGPGFGPGFPRFSAACAARQFALAAADCAMDAQRSLSLARRNAADRQAFLYAATATDPAVLRSRIPPL